MKRIVVLTLDRWSSPEQLRYTREHIKEQLGDMYVVFVLHGSEGQKVSFELFTDEKIQPIELEALNAKLGIKE